MHTVAQNTATAPRPGPGITGHGGRVQQRDAVGAGAAQVPRHLRADMAQAHHQHLCDEGGRIHLLDPVKSSGRGNAAVKLQNTSASVVYLCANPYQS